MRLAAPRTAGITPAMDKAPPDPNMDLWVCTEALTGLHKVNKGYSRTRVCYLRYNHPFSYTAILAQDSRRFARMRAV